ncbi:MAG: M20/M25/M40 family metallo-hydrolase [Candidatus Pacebacteria bacterium]|nr:M20/M25/M40 family metallo-hydrolase [Candidatus Paceibacterota bacterium]
MKQWIDEYWEREALPALMEFGTIPNVSPAFDHAWSEHGHMDRAAAFLKTWAEGRDVPGMMVELMRPDMRTPLLFIEIPGEGETVLMYGHLDKQPPMLPWREGLDPWSPVREGDLLYGRGIADDGYSLFAALGAVEAALKSGAKIPRICIMIEASEESGSLDLEHYVAVLQERIGTPRIVITLDSEDRGGDRLWLTQSLRGLVNGLLTVETIPGTMHSGLASGVVPSTGRIMRMLLSRIENPVTGHIINEVINPPLDAHKKEYASAVAKAVPDFLDGYELPRGLAAAADTLPELVANNLVRAGLEVTGITGLPTAEGSGNVMVGKLTARLSMRIPPGVDPDTVATELKRVLEEEPPYGAHVTFTPTDGGWGWIAKPFTTETLARITEASSECYSAPFGQSGIGASIPFVEIMVRTFPHSEHVLTGILSQSSHAHGPNENMSIEKVKKLTHFVAVLISNRS